ncbi:hypothetical protein [Halorhabdus amylolytica]|uniref:hypothetical protein n=1 Tax=Halorhabdus amylolytica TaxID=2559573 RepID=UPI0010AA5C26|nr:hypothetical protein [Halorhabdus amylolytica]
MSLAIEGLSIPRSTPKDQGTTLQEEVIGAVDGLEAVPDDVVEWCDAIAVDAISPSEQLPALGLPVIERGTRIEIKGAQIETSNGTHTTPGRWYVKRAAHERLLARRGVYLLVVYQPLHGVESALLAAASTLDTILDEHWYSVDCERSEDTVAKVSWPTLIARDDVNPDVGGGSGAE